MKYVVVGASAAGINGIRELRKNDKECEIILISKDKNIYSRCILHHYLGGLRDKEQLNFAESDFEELYRVKWIKGRAVVSVKLEQKMVVLEDGQKVSYDKLLLAAGAHTYIPQVKHLQAGKNVIGFRMIEDIEILKEAAQKYRNFFVMGAGLVGMDCVSGLLELGVSVTVADMAPYMLAKQLDAHAAAVYQEAFSSKGVQQYYGVGISEAVLDEAGNVKAILLENGIEIPCDYVVVTAGVRANIEFLEGSGIKTNTYGLIFDETGRTSDADVYGAGDISGLNPIWPTAVKEGIVAASNMAGIPKTMTDFFASKATMNFLGIPTMSLGNVNPEADCYQVETLKTKDSYKKIVHKNGRIEGALLQGDLAYGGVLQQLIARRIDITKVKKPIFDVDYSDFFHMKDNFEFYYED